MARLIDLEVDLFASPRTSRSVDGWLAWHDFVHYSEATPNAPAIRINGKSFSYRNVLERVLQVAREIERIETDQTTSITAIYADRSIESFVGVLAALIMGHAYVPLNPKFPDQRNAGILQQSGASFVVCADHVYDKVDGIVQSSNAVIVRSNTESKTTKKISRRHADKRAYILFTSGSTGKPKGVPISHANVDAYLTAAGSVTDFQASDRFSQNFDLTFDLSVHDMFLCWRHGAELVVPNEHDLESPAEYAIREDVTCWFSVPSLAQKMNLRGSLEAGALSNIRHSIFCGEALPLDLADKWQKATGTQVENWYGPTEATIACTRYVLPKSIVGLDTHLNLTPIGSSFPGMSSLVLDENMQEVAVGGLGELYMSGPQLASGYLYDPEKTAEAFVKVTGHNDIFYRTGDRVKVASEDEFHFVGRVDNQVKIRGYRIELGEIEAVIRELSGGRSSVVVPLPHKSSNPTALTAFVEGWDGDLGELLKSVQAKLPAYMVPTMITHFDVFPKNASGKIDRGLIAQSVESQAVDVAIDPKKDLHGWLISKAIEINPAMTREHIRLAPDLMHAGLDSIGFVEFTSVIEEQLGVELNQEMVAEMADMRIHQLTKFIQRGGKQKKKRTSYEKSRRTMELIDSFPKFVEAAPHPLVLFIGSSGTMVGIDTETIEAEAAEQGVHVTAANLGMGKLSNLGSVELVQFVHETIHEYGKEVAFIVYELEVMQLSSLPTWNEVEMVNLYRKGEWKSEGQSRPKQLQAWNFDKGGSTTNTSISEDDEPATLEPNWSLKREKEIVDTYSGNVDFSPMETEIFLAGARILEKTCANSVIFIHPLLQKEINLVSVFDPDNKFDQLKQKVSESTALTLLPRSDFELEPKDFKDCNHVSYTHGRKKLSRQIIKMLLAGRIG